MTILPLYLNLKFPSQITLQILEPLATTLNCGLLIFLPGNVFSKRDKPSEGKGKESNPTNASVSLKNYPESTPICRLPLATMTDSMMLSCLAV